MESSVYSTGNAIVDENAKLCITGNIIPQMWYRTIVRESGKPNLTAIVILADICYWYRPTEIRDESTGQIIAIKKKFKSDLLQRSYQQISEQFGISKKEATNAIIFLEKIGVIKRVFRTVTINGLVVNNVLYLELIVAKLKELTYPEERVDKASTLECDRGMLKNLNTSCQKSREGENNLPKEGAVSFKRERVSLSKERSMPLLGAQLSHPGEIRHTPVVETNTEIITEITNRDYINPIISYQAAEALFKKQIDYDAIWIDRPCDRSQLDDIVAVAVDVLTSTARTMRINCEERPTEVVQSIYKKLRKESVEYVIDSIRQCGSKATNIRAVIITSLYNATMTVKSYYNNLYAHNEAVPPDIRG